MSNRPLLNPLPAQRIVRALFEHVGSTIAEFEAFQKQGIARASAIIKAGNVQAD